ncbi:GNAT family N-acetyltransferase [Streptomyces sp. Inha503]|uniref:GNAT family N-acetyltransferase n=1 Tax=Streptomyces sp. Inha503 TaxID=3383314 RepID=UPI0039A1B2A4
MLTTPRLRLRPLSEADADGWERLHTDDQVNQFVGPYTQALGETEIGWTFARAHWGNGYATEAARAVLAWGFGALGVGQITAMLHHGNTASATVARRQRAGTPLQQDGHAGHDPASRRSGLHSTPPPDTRPAPPPSRQRLLSATLPTAPGRSRAGSGWKMGPDRRSAGGVWRSRRTPRAGSPRRVARGAFRYLAGQGGGRADVHHGAGRG